MDTATPIRPSVALDPSILAIDGPAASGKSTIGYRLAQVLGYLFFDTGVMYRAITWMALDRGLDVHDAAAIGLLAEQTEIDVRAPAPGEQDGRHCTVLIDGQDITWSIRSQAVDQNVSVVSANPRVREALTRQQRRIGLRYAGGLADLRGIVMVGRDIGTVVLPDAGLKVYLDAISEERARRRCRELQARGQPADFDQVFQEIQKRDKLDSERALSPLVAAADAQVVDTSDLSPDQVVGRILDLIAARSTRLGDSQR